MRELVEYDVAVVGGSGFVGSHLTKYLVNVFKVKVLDVKPFPLDLEEEIAFQTVDVTDYGSIVKGVRDATVVIHTAIIGIPLINSEKRLGYEVNVLGTQNVCEAVHRNETTKGLILTGTWHVFGERDLRGIINEEFGCRPDKVEERARFYALSKTVQENVVRLYDESLDKIFGIVRLGTVLGEGMPEKTAANTFIFNALIGKPITPYKHSMYRPMLYIDVDDVCKAVKAYSKKLLDNEIEDKRNSLAHIVNLAWPKPITILDLAEIVKSAVKICSKGKIAPTIEVVDTGVSIPSEMLEKTEMRLSVENATRFLGIKSVTNPRESIERLVRKRMAS